MRRILVGSAPVRFPGESKPRHIPAHTGVLFWRNDGADIATIVVKATASFQGEGLSFVEPRPWVANNEVAGRANDFVPLKARRDIFVLGHADILGAAQQVIVRARGTSIAFTLTSGEPGRVPLAPPYLVVTGDGSSEIGPHRRQLELATHGFAFEREFDYGAFNAAHPRLQSPHVPNGSTITIEGLDPSGPLVLELPLMGARALVEWSRRAEPSDAALVLDTIHVDLDGRFIDLVWRGLVNSSRDPRKQIDRILVGFASDEQFDGLETDDPVERFGHPLAELPRGRFGYAWEREDVLEGKEPPPLPEEELEMARYEAFAGSSAPSPTLTLAEHAAISAKLLEIPYGSEGSIRHGEERAELLRRNGFDEYEWSLEERAHIDRLAALPEDATGGIHTEYGKLFVEAQDRLAPPDERLLDAKNYALISTRLQVERPNEVLADAKMSLGAWMRTERKWQARMIDDPGASREVAGYLEAESAERGEPKVPDYDDDGRPIE